MPEVTGFLAYTYIIVGAGALTALASEGARWIAALVVFLLAPLHAVFLVGWRAHAASGTYVGGGTIVTLATVGAVLVVFAPALFDRLAYNSPPIGEVANDGSLLLLGGADSTTTTGALSEFDPRDVGVARARAETLSYRRGGERYDAADTRGDLDVAASRMSEQIRGAPAPRRLLGHSQASLIIDRLVANDLAVPNASVVFAPSVPYPPDIDVPAPNVRGPGKPGGDATRALSAMLDAVGLQPFDVDAPASPTNLDPLLVRRAGFPRLAVWALADSVWLDGDWRRPGETNIVIFTDHVGATNNARALDAARRWFAGGSVPDDESNWRGAAVSVLRYVMAPWRPR